MTLDRLPSPKCFLGETVRVRDRDGSWVRSTVEGLTCAGPDSEYSPGFWYWVQSEAGERWVHESRLELGHTGAAATIRGIAKRRAHPDAD